MIGWRDSSFIILYPIKSKWAKPELSLGGSLWRPRIQQSRCCACFGTVGNLVFSRDSFRVRHSNTANGSRLPTLSSLYFSAPECHRALTNHDLPACNDCVNH